jgi:hypothetical protein
VRVVKLMNGDSLQLTSTVTIDFQAPDPRAMQEQNIPDEFFKEAQKIVDASILLITQMYHDKYKTPGLDMGKVNVKFGG